MYICKMGYLAYSRARGILWIQTRRQDMQIENDIEKYLIRQIKRTGALCYKFTSQELEVFLIELSCIKVMCFR